MCLLIHKRAGAELPACLIDSAVDYNPHGFGLMTYGDDGRVLVRRRVRSRKSELHALVEQFQDRECVIHLRYGTSGVVDHTNTHPIRITRDIYMAHNGTVNLQRHDAERSDTWHLVNDYLRPILSRRPEVLHDQFFHELVTHWCGPHNRFVFMDGSTRRTVIVNRDSGHDFGGLWLSNTRWFDPSQLGLQVQAGTAQAVDASRFCI